MTLSRNIVLGSSSDVSNALTFTPQDGNAIAEGGTNHGFGLIALGAASGNGAISTAGNLSLATKLTVQSPGVGSGGISLSNSLGAGAGNALILLTSGKVSVLNNNAALVGAVLLQASGGLSTTVGLTLNVTGTINLNSVPLGAGRPCLDAKDRDGLHAGSRHCRRDGHFRRFAQQHHDYPGRHSLPAQIHHHHRDSVGRRCRRSWSLSLTFALFGCGQGGGGKRGTWRVRWVVS